jgi:hypothetical protein
MRWRHGGFEKKLLANKMREPVEAKKRNRQTESFVRQLLKDERPISLIHSRTFRWRRSRRVQRRRRRRWTRS